MAFSFRALQDLIYERAMKYKEIMPRDTYGLSPALSHSLAYMAALFIELSLRLLFLSE